MNNKQIESLYAKMLEQHKKETSPNRTNCYSCPKCGHITKTIDVDDGVTPMFHRCEKCSEFARSSFYRDIAPHVKPTQEWFRPTLDQVKKMYRKGNLNMMDHVLNGGLESRIIK